MKTIAFHHKILLIFTFITASLLAPETIHAATTYYVDSQSGNDGNSGTSPGQAWRTMEKVGDTTFSAGDSILFRRNQTFTINNNGMFLNGNGNSESRITLGSYGSGDPPVLSNTNTSNKFTYVIGVWGPYWTIQDIKIDSLNDNIIEDGIRVWDNANNVIIQNNHITGVAKGIKLHGSDSIIRNNLIHDLIMLINTPGGDDDVGAIGVEVTRNGSVVSDVQIHNNTFKNLKQHSYDYGTDGAAVEFYDASDGVRVFNNWIENVDSMTEFGSGNNQTISNITFHHNIVLNPAIISYIHNDDSSNFTVNIENISIEHNTIVKNSSTVEGYGIGFVSSNNNNNEFMFRNNIISYHNTETEFAYNPGNFIHTHNLYYLSNIAGGGNAPNYELGVGEINGIDPFFTDQDNNDFTLLPTSPATAIGAYLGYTHDYNLSPIPTDSPPDLGAFQHSYTDPTPTPTPTPSPTYSNIIYFFGKTGTRPEDLNNDGVVNIFELNLWISSQ